MQGEKQPDQPILTPMTSTNSSKSAAFWTRFLNTSQRQSHVVDIGFLESQDFLGYVSSYTVTSLQSKMLNRTEETEPYSISCIPRGAVPTMSSAMHLMFCEELSFHSLTLGGILHYNVRDFKEFKRQWHLPISSDCFQETR